MQAAVFANVGQLAILDRPSPSLRSSTDVLLDVEACGICGTDLHILSNPPGHPARVGVTLGHEFVGTITEVGDAVNVLRPRDRVVVAANIACGECARCRCGLVNHCEDFTSHGVFADGGLAARVVVPARNCYRIAPRVPSHIAALAEPLSTVVNGARLAGVFPGETAVVIGAGPIGLLFTVLLRHTGARVIVLEPAQFRADVAQLLGAWHVLDPLEEDAPKVVAELTEDFGADVVVDAVGSRLGLALDLVRVGGRIVLFGMDSRAVSEVRQVRITRDELSILGGYVGSPEVVFPAAVKLLEHGRVDFNPMVTARIQLADLPAAIQQLRARDAVKIIVEF